MSRPLLRSYTGAFGFGGEFCQALLDLEGALAERTQRTSQAPPEPKQMEDEDADPEPVTLPVQRRADEG